MLASSVLCLCLLLSGVLDQVVSAQEEAEGQTWTQWRGEKRDGVFNGPAWPDKLDESVLKQTWRVELGDSYSGPIVSEDFVFVTETKDKQSEVVRALDRETGKQVWETQWPGAMRVPFFANANGSWIRSTPTYHEGNLYVGGMVDVLACLDASDGKEIWKIDFPKSTGTRVPSFGFVCSPLVMDGAVFAQVGGAFYKLNKDTGEVIWKTLDDGGGMNGSAFSSPFPTEIDGVKQLLVQGRDKLNGIDAESGQVLWSQQVPSFRGMNILTPIVHEDGVFTSSYRNSSFFYRPRQQSGSWSVDTQWQTAKAGYMSSPVIKDGFVYLHLGNQRFTCMDLKTGEVKWTSGLFGKYSSMILQDDKILALDQKGELLLIRTNPEKFELLDRREVSNQETWAHLAAAGDELFVRELKAISAFKFQSSK